METSHIPQFLLLPYFFRVKGMSISFILFNWICFISIIIIIIIGYPNLSMLEIFNWIANEFELKLEIQIGFIIIDFLLT